MQADLVDEHDVLAEEDVASVPGFDPMEAPTVWDVFTGVVPPGPEAITLLSDFDPTSCALAVRIEYAAAWQACRNWLEAQALAAVAAVSAPVPDEDVPYCPTTPDEADFMEVATADLALALNASETYVGQRLDLARDLADRLPVTMSALGRGSIGLGHVYAIRELTTGLDDTECARVEARVFPRGETQSVSQFRTSVRRVVASLRPRDLSAAFAAEAERTGVTYHPKEHGRAGLWIEADVVSILEIKNALDAEAAAWTAHRQALGQPRVPLQTLRFEVVQRLARVSCREVADARSGSTDPSVGDTSDQVPPGLRAGLKARCEVIVQIDLPTLLALRDGSGVIPGYGPIPVELARDLAASTTWRRLVTEPVDGHLLDLGRRRYRPSAKMRDHLLGLGQRCSAPGCNRAAAEFDHARPWSEGGGTSVQNGNPACHHHHRLKTIYGYRTVRHPDGSVEWITPGGNTSRRPPDDHRVNDYGVNDYGVNDEGLPPDAPPF